MRLGRDRDRLRAESQIDPMLVQRRDILGGDEALPMLPAHHDAVKNVLFGGRDDVIDAADLGSVAVVDRDVTVECQIGDGGALVHDQQSYADAQQGADHPSEAPSAR